MDKSIGQQILELFRESVIVSGFIAMGCVGAVLYLSITGKPVPDILSNVCMIVVGFFFGGKVQQANANLLNRIGR